MNSFEQQNEAMRRKNAAEGRELSMEAKEKQVEQAEKKLAAKERIEVTSKEIKITKNQIQNIVANMAQVVKAVAAIRAQLGLVANDDDIPSVQQDQKIVEGLRKKLDTLFGEIGDLKVALAAEEEKAVREEFPDWTQEYVVEEVRKRVQRIVSELGLAGEAGG